MEKYLKENLHRIAEQVGVREAMRLQALAHSLHKLDEAECNDGLSARQEHRETRLEQEAATIAAAQGRAVYRQSDPRGCPLYLYDPADVRPGDSIDSIYPSIGIGVSPHGRRGVR